MADLSLKSSYLRINNITLRVPPKDISIIKNEFNASAAALRSTVSTHIKSGRKNIRIVINTIVAAGYDAEKNVEVDLVTWVNQEVSPLIIQARKLPFVSIENEKIRKELMGDYSSAQMDDSQTRNIAGVIKNISINSNARQPDFYNLSIIMDVFNYTPFSPNFQYKHVESSGAILAVNTPGNQFEHFINSGTTAPVQLGGSLKYVNAIDTSKDLEIVYKEYQRIDLEKLFAPEFDQLTSLEVDKSETNIPLINEDSKYIGRALVDLQKEGWILADDFSSTLNEPGRIIYRYRRFKIKGVNPNEIIESGKLIIESATASLTTLTPSIPLLSHSIPTSQFLGATDPSLGFVIFANAELENGLNHGRPIGTSSELSRLNSIIELVNKNAIEFRRVSKNDCIFIKHPLAKLLKYKTYDEKRLQLAEINQSTGNVILDFFNPEEYLACIVNSSQSRTIDGLPFCSRFELQLSENYRSSNPTVQQKNIGPSNRIYDATKNIVKKLASKFLITKDTSKLNGKFFFGEGAPITDPDFKAAQKLLVSLNDSLFFKDYQSANEVIDDNSLVEKRTKEYRSLVDEGFYPLSSDRLNETADDLLNILANSEPNDNKFSIYTFDVEEFKNFNIAISDSNYPDMLLPDDNISPDFFFFNYSEEENNRHKRKILGDVRQRYIDTSEQFIENIGNEDAGTKIDNNFMGSYGPPVTASNIIASGEKKNRKNKTETDKAFVQAPLDLTQQFQNIQTAVNNFTDNTYSMKRAFPTFKLFIRDQEVDSLSDVDKDRLGRLSRGGIWRNFSDLYDINGIVDIRLVKSKNNPVDILVIRMLNTKEDIVNKAFEDPTSYLERKRINEQKTVPKNGKTEGKNNKVDLNELDAVMLREGTRVELRLGYESNPNALPVEFSGRIMQVSGGDVVEIVCQGDGVELVQELKGVGIADEFDFNSDTANIISQLLNSCPEIVSFGTTDSKSIIGDLSVMWQFAGGRTINENIFTPTLFSSWGSFGSKTIKYAGTGFGVGAIFAGIGSIPATLIGGGIGLAADIKDAAFKFFKGSPFNVYEQTAWDVLQELTLRHPGTICSVTPYDRRSTIFFGYPDQLYFHRGPSYFESLQLKGDSDSKGLLSPIERIGQDALRSKTGGLDLLKIKDSNEARAEILKRKVSKNILKNVMIQTANGLIPDFISLDESPLSYIQDVKPGEIYIEMLKAFRNYHIVTSEHDIIENNLMVNSDGVYNSIQVVYPKKSSETNLDGSVGFTEYEKTDEIKADDDLNRDYIKRQTLVFHNAHKDINGADLPEQYAISSLCKSLNNAYRGKITILGRQGIKPHDIVFVYDTYNSIYGPVEVDSVIHTFSYDTGWVTEIIPHMVVTPTTSTSIVHVNAMQKMAHSFYLKNTIRYYSGTLFDEKGNLLTDLADNSSLARSMAADAASDSLVLIGGAGSTLLAERLAVDAYSKLSGSKSLDVAKNIGGGTKSSFGKALIKGTSRAAGIGLPLFAGLAVDYLHGYYVNWSKFRQPIIFLPVTRNGKPWYTGLYGLNNNTELDAVKNVGRDIIQKTDDVVRYFQREFPEIFE